MDADETHGHVPPRAGLSPPWAQEGHDLSRLLALSDGIFAFAMTLLVLGLTLPAAFAAHQLDDLWSLFQSAFIVYVLSFFVISFYWLAHHQIFAYVVGYDRRLMQLNITFLLFIAVMPFVTAVLAGGHNSRLSVGVYAGAQVAAGGTLTILWLYATRGRHHVDPGLPQEWVDYITLRTAASPVLFAASIPIAFFHYPLYAEVSWVSLFVLQGLLRVKVRRGSRGEAKPGPRHG